MKQSPAEQDAIVALLTRIYTDLSQIEEQFQLFTGVDDFRPRIDYFHDAIRAFTSEDPAARKPGGRLSVEMLAYDLGCLRYIQTMPLSPFRPGGETLSPSSEMVMVTPGLAVKGNKPDRSTRERISELYQSYAVMYAALLKPFADADFKDRIETLDREVTDISTLIHCLEQMERGKANVTELSHVAQHLDEDGLRQMTTAFIHQEKYKNKDHIRKFIDFLKKYTSDKDAKIAGIDKAHMNYATAQLAIFEDSKEMLKKMAGQGMNLVGKFVQASVAQARRDAGIGR